MKNDIDSILDSMFRDGKLNFGGAKRRNEQTQQALESARGADESRQTAMQAAEAAARDAVHQKQRQRGRKRRARMH